MPIIEPAVLCIRWSVFLWEVRERTDDVMDEGNQGLIGAVSVLNMNLEETRAANLTFCGLGLRRSICSVSH